MNSQSTASSGDAGRDVSALLPQVRDVMQAMPANQRVVFNRFWTTVRETLRGSQNEIDELRETVTALRGGASISRPPTSNSVVALRNAMDRAMADEASFELTSADIEEARGLPPNWLRNHLTGMRIDGGRHPLGCWTSRNAPSSGGYVKTNLRNTRHPLFPNRKIGINVYVHQLAVIAAGRGNQLAMTRPGGGFEVSHLCHTSGCFNPDHLVVEPGDLNRARNSCQGRVVIEHAGAVLHPCSHWCWGNGGHRECILPKSTIPPHQARCWLRADGRGGFVVRG